MSGRHRCLSLLALVGLLLTPAHAAPTSPDPAIATCARQLLAIGQALAAYQREKKGLPPNLSDLYPRYLKDKALFLCPADPPPADPGWAPLPRDPNLPISYFYELNLQPGPWGALPGPQAMGTLVTWRQYKMAQRVYFGDRLPVVCCVHHRGTRERLNLTLKGQVYRSLPSWEYDPETVPTVLARMQNDLAAGPAPFQRRWPPQWIVEYFSQVPLLPRSDGRARAGLQKVTPFVVSAMERDMAAGPQQFQHRWPLHQVTRYFAQVGPVPALRSRLRALAAKLAKLPVTSTGDVSEAVASLYRAAGESESAIATSMAAARRRLELDLQLGHSDWVVALAFSPDERWLASGGMDHTLKLWNVSTGEVQRTLTGHSHAVAAVAFSPDGKTVASGSFDETVRLWDVQSGAPVRVLTGHSAHVHAVAFSPDGRRLATGSDDGTVRIWDAGTGVSLRTLTGHEAGEHGSAIHAVVFSPDGRWLASGGYDETVRIWDARTGALQRTLKGHVARVETVAVSPDGQVLASAGEDKMVRLWDPRTGALLRALTGHEGMVWSAAFSRDGRLVASASDDGTVRVWDPATGSVQRTLEGRAPVASLAVTPSGRMPVRSVAFSPDGVTLATGSNDAMVRLWHAQTGQTRQMLGSYGIVFGVVFAPDGKVMASAAADKMVRLWDTQTGTLRRTLAGHTDQVYAVLFSPDGRQVASSGADQTVRLWNTETGALLRTLTGPTGPVFSLAFSPDGRLVAGGDSGGMIRVWDSQTGSALRTLQGHEGHVHGLAFSPDGKTLVSGADDQTVRVWDAATGGLLRTLKGHSAHVHAAAVSPDGRVLASAGEDQTVRLWDLRTGSPLRVLSVLSGGATSVTFSPDGRTVAWTGGEHTVLRWDAQTGTPLPTLTTPRAMWVTFSPDGSRMATGGGDGTVRLWEARTDRLLATFLSLPSTPAVRPNTAARPITAPGKELPPSDDYLVFTPEGYYSGSAGADRFVRFRLGELGFPAESFQARYYRPDLVKQALAGKPLPPVGAFKGAYPPVAAFTTPQTGAKVMGDTLQVSLATTDDSDIRSIALFVNGARVDAKPITAGSRPITALGKGVSGEGSRPPTPHKTARTFTAVVPLPPGETAIRLQVIAYDEDGLQSPRHEIFVTREQTAAARGRLLGLCVGISRYEDPRLNLQYADRDASALAKALNRQRGIYASAQVAALTNETATRPQVITALDELIARTTRTDTVVVLLSGHGWRSDERSFYFATHEVNRNQVATTALPWREVVQRLTRLSEKSRRVIVLLDACHSGSAATNEELVKAVLSANAGVMVFASSRGSEVSLELPEPQHGAFTQALLEGLEGRAAPENEASVTLWDFASYVRRRVKELTGGVQNPQIPFLQDFDTDAAIASKR